MLDFVCTQEQLRDLVQKAADLVTDKFPHDSAPEGFKWVTRMRIEPAPESGFDIRLEWLAQQVASKP